MPVATQSLEAVLASWRADAEVLARYGCQGQAEMVLRLAAEIAAAAEPFTKRISETEAHLKSGWSVRWLRRWHAEARALGLAWEEGGRRLYLDVTIPQRTHRSAIEAEARDALLRASGKEV